PRRSGTLHHWYAKALRIIDVRVVKAAPVADPAFVDVVVLTRSDTHELTASLPEGNAAAVGALGADAAGLRHVPRPRLEPPHARREGADGAEIDDVAAEDRGQGLVELARDERLDAALAGRQLLLPRDLVVVASAPIAEHAALAIESDVRREGDRLFEVEPRPIDSARRVSVAECEVLQRALATLVAHRAVERMVHELELENLRTRLHGHRALRLDHHVRRHRRGTGRLRARRPRRDVDQAEPARSDGIELVVVAEDGNLDA